MERQGGNGDRLAGDTLAPARGNVPQNRPEQHMQPDTGAEEKRPELTPLRREFLRLYLSPDTETFFNATRSWQLNYLAKKCGRQQASIRGSRMARTLKPFIADWLEEMGLDDVALKSKIVAGMYAKETKFFQHEGVVTDTREVEALGIQYKFTELAAKVTGLLRESIHIAGVSELAQRMVTANKRLERMRGHTEHRP